MWYDYITACLPEGISPMDLDAMVERNGYFLFVESKDFGVNVPIGQGIALQAIYNKLRPKAVLIFQVGKKGFDHGSAWNLNGQLIQLPNEAEAQDFIRR